MRKKFTYLISLAVAMICSSGGVAWGQTYWGDADLANNSKNNATWVCDNDGPYDATLCSVVNIFGYKYYSYINSIEYYDNGTTSSNPYTKPGSTSCDTDPGDVTKYYRYWATDHWVVKKVVYESIQDASCSSGGHNYHYANANVTDYATVSIPTSFIGGGWNYTASPANHSHSSIIVKLKATQNTLNFYTPHYTHYRWDWTYSGGWVKTQVSDGDIDNNTMNVNATLGLRLTGSNPQIKNNNTNLTAKLAFGAHKLFFDDNWNGSTNNVTVTGWNDFFPTSGARKVSSGEFIGFNKDYSGSQPINVNAGGYLVLGGSGTVGAVGCANSDHSSVATTTVTDATIDEYYFHAPDGCSGGPQNVDMKNAQEKVVVTVTGTGTITNSNDGCWAVNFCDLFGGANATVASGGTLNITPSTTNFNAGVNLTAALGTTNIISKDINVYTGADFKWLPTAQAFMNVYIKDGQGGCTGCGVFNIEDNIETKNIANGTFKVYDHDLTIPNSTGKGSVIVGKNYKHTGATGKHSIDVFGKIDVGGTTDFTASSKDEVDFKSNGSFINFGNTFQYTGEGPGYLNIWANGGCGIGEGVCYDGGFVNFAGKVTTTSTADNKVKIESTKSYVQMKDGFLHDASAANATGDMYVKAPNSQVRILSAKNLEIKRGGDATDSISGKSVYVEGTTTYTQTVTTATTHGLHIKGWGAPCTDYCNWPDNFVNKGGYVYLTKAVKTTNTKDGITNIISNLDSVGMGDGYTHTGVDGDMLVSGETAVHIWGGTAPKGLDIARTNTVPNKGNDAIVSQSGNIYIQNGVNYAQNTALLTGYEFKIWANGACGSPYCDGSLKGGPVVVDDLVKVVHKGDGTTTIQSTKDSVGLHKGYQYTGVNGNMTVNGYSGVELTGDVVTINRAPNATPVPVWDNIVSPKGQVHVEKDFTYNLTSNAVTGGLLVEASQNGYNCSPECGSYGGYAWFEAPVAINANIAGVTPNNNEGESIIRSNGHFVRMDDTYTYKGFNGNMLIEANGNCATACGDLNSAAGSTVANINNGEAEPNYEEGYLTAGQTLLTTPLAYTKKAYDGRPTGYTGGGYVWIQGPVDIKYLAADEPEGNATIRSKYDIVQFDNTFAFLDTKGSNLLIDGNKGVRSLSSVNITNSAFSSNQGNTMYHSAEGFVDFGDVFNYTAPEDSSRLEIFANDRIEFAKPVTIEVGGTATEDDKFRENQVVMDAVNGFIDFQNTLDYGTTKKKTRGSFVMYAGGTNVGMRSCIDSSHYCEENGGQILFREDFTYNNDTTGNLFMRSKYDDVEFRKNFTYVNAATNTHGGNIIVQAGQDIYASGDARANVVSIQQAGQQSILFEAKKTIRIRPKFTVDRSAGTASKGDITLKAGYDNFTSDSTFTSQNPWSTAGYADSLGEITWTAPEVCMKPDDYTSRLGCASLDGGDIWLQSDAEFKFGTTADQTIATTLRAWNSIFIDSSFLYTQNYTNVKNHSNILLHAHTGNIEAIRYWNNSRDVHFDLQNLDNTQELRLQAGNQVTGGKPQQGEMCAASENCLLDWSAPKAEYDGNILFNKPLVIDHKGRGETFITSSRDIEYQINAPSVFNYNTNDAYDSIFYMSAGRHIETHSGLVFNFQKPNIQKEDGIYDGIGIKMEAGRLASARGECDPNLCKTFESGTQLTDVLDTDNGTAAYDPANAPLVSAQTIDNTFAAGGVGHGSILMFDSVTFNYDGKGKILMVAENGNIESDPYLHRSSVSGDFGNSGVGYNSQNNIHDAQLTFNHGGTGITEMKAIDIKLHDKVFYEAFQAAVDSNGQFYMSAYDSVLTRNLMYINPTDTGSVFITTAKYKDVSPHDDCGEYNCTEGGPGIHQGHIVLGYGADCLNQNLNDSIVFDFSGNPKKVGANLHIRAGFLGYTKNTVTGQAKSGGVFKTHPYTQDADRGKAYGGNITFDFMKVTMAVGDGNIGGYTEIQTPNGNIWGKDSLQYHGIDGNLRIDAGLGSLEDTVHAVRWDAFTGYCNGNGKEQTLNTEIPTTCNEYNLWRTGNIMMKGGSLNFGVPSSTDGGKGNAIFRTREGFIDTYDAFTVDSMSGDLVKYAGTLNSATEPLNEWGDVSERDFEYHQIAPKSGSIFYGADDNIMMNYGYSNYDRGTSSDGFLYNGVGDYDVTTRGAANKLVDQKNPYYYTSYGPNDGFINECRAIYNVNEDGYMWYRDEASRGKSTWKNNNYHLLYRTCHDGLGETCSPITGECKTVDNKARLLTFNFDKDAAGTSIMTGGLGMVATNFIDMFTKFTYFGGQGSGMGSVPEMNTLHGESVEGYGLYLKSLFNGQRVEKRRATCEGCGEMMRFPMEGKSSEFTYEWTYIGFHDDARIHTQNQKSLIEAPVVEFFGHAELDSYTDRGSKTKLTVKGDSLIFHDSAIFDGNDIELLPYTTGAQRQNDMRYGVINDGGKFTDFYKQFGPAIQMPDRNTPVLEFGYQRCNEPDKAPQAAPNERSKAGFESTPMVGGDVIVSFQNGFSLPIYNTVVANNARISFISDSLDGIYKGGEYVDTYIRTDLLRIRNKVEFYTGQNEFGLDENLPKNRRGLLKMSSIESQTVQDQGTGIFPRHLHTEPGSELSLPGEDSLVVYSTTTVGGFGNIHENILVKANGTIAPGFASLMEWDCQTPHRQGQMTIHNLTMEKDAIFRISIGRNNPCLDEYGEPNYSDPNCTATDTLVVEDSIWFNGKIPLHVLPETEVLDPGCYLFLEYGDSLGVTPEYVKNFTLTIDRYQDYYFGLQYTPGKVYLCVMTFPQPVVQRYVKLPAVEGVTTTPNAGTHYVVGHQNFSFTAKYSGTPLKVTATGYYNGGPVDLDQTATILPDGSYQYTIYQVVQPYDVEFGPETSSVQVGNDYMGGPLVYAYKNTLHINVEKEDIVSIYNMTGVLYRKIEVPAGNSKFTLDKGMYIVTLKDGSVHKIVIK